MSETPAAVHASPHPRLSIVAVWPDGGRELRDWLRALARVQGIAEIEIVIVAPGSAGPLVASGHELPKLRHLEAAASADTAAQRRAGMAAVTGDIILFTDWTERDFPARLATVIHTYSGRSR